MPKKQDPFVEVFEETGIQNIDGILGGIRWSDEAIGGTADPEADPLLADGLTFSFPDSSEDYPKGYGEAKGNKFLSLTDDTPSEAYPYNEQDIVRTIFDQINQLTALTIEEATNDADGDIRIAKTSQITDADDGWAYYPGGDNGNGKRGGDVWINPSLGNNTPDDPDNPDSTVGSTFGGGLTLDPGSYSYAVYMHEIGHALGLEHPDGGGIFGPVENGFDGLEYSIMSNNASVEIDGWTYSDEDLPSTFMQLDIAALQAMYGANYDGHIGDGPGGSTTYQWDSVTGELYINGIGQGDLNPSNNIFMTIWDGGGVDTYDFSNYSADITIDLNPGGWIAIDDLPDFISEPGADYTLSQRASLWSRRGDDTDGDGVGDGFNPENPQWAVGNIANALVFDFNEGDGTAGWIENAIGGTGNDTFIANAAANTFFFEKFSGVDEILDFENDTDRININPYKDFANVEQFDAWATTHIREVVANETYQIDFDGIDVGTTENLLTVNFLNGGVLDANDFII